MNLLFLDTSAIVRACLDDEPEHEGVFSLLFAEPRPLAASTLARLETYSALESAGRNRRLTKRKLAELRLVLDHEFGQSGKIELG